MLNDWTKIQLMQKEAVKEDPKKSITQGKEQLSIMRRMLTVHQDEWLAALRQDLGKCQFEGYATELAVLLNEIDYLEKKMDSFLRTRKSSRWKFNSITNKTIVRRPYGSVLVISPWNYPLQLSLMPVIGAITCGNRCFLKPSEHAPATAALLGRLVPEYFSEDWIVVVNGDASVSKALLELDWDFIFFTGSETVGRSVYMEAAKYQTPVVLELGGKNPCIIDQSGFTDDAIWKIVWGKFLNAGQTCVAPDTLFVNEAIYPDVLKKIKDTIELFYGGNPIESSDYGRIIHENHLNRLNEYLKDGEVYFGGGIDIGERYFSPTVLTKIRKDTPVLRDEIFGPILPVVPYGNLNKLLDELRDFDPLAAYIFSRDKDTIEEVSKRTKTRAIGVNEVILHVADPRIAFGGIGSSGLGSYHGKASIETFTYEQLIYESHDFFRLNQQFPPYDPKHFSLLQKLRRWLI
ncbi:aldehyde dehydrogenase family protein [Aciduricibacillus chroicocephali]|uniref:Aldehyde dehydrogenase n=1 Tax=Aciduricibacillus chroicocephali TaxID=3054939 RepID=A0ABY9KZ42_9BACI|nr:aldehyde dehydrogenase family protein [Bacillaceae bacterium 44XB]